jgi:plasmid stability protein
MPTLTIKNMPEDVYQRLKESARRHRRSLNSEAIVCLERSLGRSHRGVEETLASLRLLHERLKNLPPLDDDFLETAKHQGRQ